MKVIVAGFNKTGTKSAHIALKELGYNVYDVADHFWYHNEEWIKIMSSGKGGSIEDFKKMYQDVDVVIDAPTYLFWEEIHKAFPDAKVGNNHYKDFTSSKGTTKLHVIEVCCKLEIVFATSLIMIVLIGLEVFMSQL